MIKLSEDSFLDIFLVVKQFVDVVYQLRLLDYGMVIFAAALMAFGFVKNKYGEGFLKRLCVTDYIMVALGLVYLLSFLRETGGRVQFIKTESAFFIYFLGRIFGQGFAAGLLPDGKSLSAPVSGKLGQGGFRAALLPLASYLILYANFFYKIYVQVTYRKTKVYVGRPEFNIHSDGALYYYKTDLAIGVIVALIFIYFYSKMQLLKWVTILPVGMFMLFYETQAKSGQIILLMEYVLFLIFELYKRGVFARFAGRSYRKKEIGETVSQESMEGKAGKTPKKTQPGSNKKDKIFFILTGIIFIALTAFFIFISTYPPLKVRLEDLGLSKQQMKKLEHIFHTRHLIWWDAISYFVQQPFGTRLIGIDLVSETLHNSLEDRFHNLYFKQIYSIGYLGCYLYTAVLCKVMRVIGNGRRENIQLRIMTLAFWIMFLVMSISMEGLEYTQMSWYPFIFLGMAVSAEKA